MQTPAGFNYSLYGGVAHRDQLSRLEIILVIVGALLLMSPVALKVTGYSLSLHTATSTKSLATTLPVEQSTNTLAPTNIDTTSEPAPVTPDPSTAVTQAVQAVIAQNPAASWSVVAYDLTNNRWLTQINPNQQMASASLYKLFAAYALAQKLPMSQWASRTVAGHSLQDCVDLMLRVSDNPCGQGVGDLVGSNNIDKTIHAAGFKQTFTNRSSGPITTASDTLNFMIKLNQGKLFNAPTTAFVLSSLQRQSYRSGIPAGCRGCMVYNKTGNTDSVAHDAAVVQADGWQYAVVIMSTGGSYSKIAQVEQALQGALPKL